jgi:hypothetical protein
VGTKAIIAVLIMVLLFVSTSCSTPPARTTQAPLPSFPIPTTPVPVPPLKTSPSATLPMMTHISRAFGISIGYPESWKVQELTYQGITNEVFIADRSLIGQVSIITLDESYKKQTNCYTPTDRINLILADTNSPDRSLLTKPTKTMVDGHDACTVSYILTRSNKYCRYISIMKGTLLYSVKGVAQDPLFRPEIDAVLDSFRFTN